MGILQQSTIQWLRSAATQQEFPNLVFVADVDFATAGMVSLSSLYGSEVVAARMTADECSTADADEAAAACQKRINAELQRKDLRIVRFIRSEEQFTESRNISFQEFQRHYKPPRLIYHDIYSDYGEAFVVREQSVRDFTEGGGKVIDHLDQGSRNMR